MPEQQAPNVTELARQVAPLLSRPCPPVTDAEAQQWTVQPNRETEYGQFAPACYAELTLPTGSPFQPAYSANRGIALGPTISIQAFQNRRDQPVRLSVSGSFEYPFGPRMGDCVTTINISASKTAEQIAKDINRRLLPTYLEQFRLQAERKRKTLEAENRSKQIAQKLAEILKASFTPANDYNQAIRLYLDVKGSEKRHLYGDIDVSGNGDVEIKIHSLTEIEAEFFCSAIAKIANGAAIKREPLGGFSVAV